MKSYVGIVIAQKDSMVYAAIRNNINMTMIIEVNIKNKCLNITQKENQNVNVVKNQILDF